MKKIFITVVSLFIFCAAYSQQKNDVRAGEVLSISKEVKKDDKTTNSQPIKSPAASEKLNLSKTKTTVVKKNNSPLKKANDKPSSAVLSTEEKRK